MNSVVSCLFVVVASALWGQSRLVVCRNKALSLLRQGGWVGLVLEVLQCACGPASFAGTVSSPVIDPEVRRGIAEGSVRVIVELRIAAMFRPEGELPDPSAVAAQRSAIAAAQGTVLSRLQGTQFTLIHQYDSVPLLALEIGPDALVRMETFDDLVSRVVLDATRHRMSSPRPRS